MKAARSVLQCRCRRSAVFASPSSRCSTWLTRCRPLPSYGSSSLASILMFRRTNVGSGAGVVVVVRDLSVWFPIQQINPSYLPGGSNVHASTQHVVVCDLSVRFPIQQSRLVFASPQTTQSFSPIHPAYHSDRPNPKTIHSFFRRPMEGGTPAT